MRTRALGIMGKVPEPGAVKTRLSPPLTLDQAAELFRAFLRDSMLTALDVQNCLVRVILLPGGDPVEIANLAPAGVEFAAQTGDGLGTGMRDAFRDLKATGARHVVLIGSDIPTLPARHVDMAFAALESGDYDLVLGPAHDGGYYLIGLTDDQPRLFDGPEWGTDRVLAQTMELAERLGLRLKLLPEWYDIDEPADLDRLVDDLGHDGTLAAPATRVTLQTLRRMGAAVPESPTPWTVREQRVLHESHWRTFVLETVQTHTGDEIEYTSFMVPDAVWIVPVTADGDIVLIRQYRHPVREWVLEIPAGGIDGKSYREVADLELREEVGGTSDQIHYMGAFYSSTGHASLRGHVYLALDVRIGEAHRESTELMVQVRVSAARAFDMARRGEISDGQSALALLYCERAVMEWLEDREHV